MSLNYLTSSQEFIQFLNSHEKKTATNNGSKRTPPPPKIEIASQAWEDKDFYLPRKEEVLVEWLIGRVIGTSSRGTDTDTDISPLFNLRYWSLLLSILTTTTTVTKNWLPSLIHRLPPLTNVIVTFLASPSHNPNEHTSELLDRFTKSLTLLFPHASRRMSIDALGEVLRAIFRFLARRSVGTQTDEMNMLFGMILGEYKRSFGVASVGVKKKVYNNFVQNYLEDWMRAVVFFSSDSAESKNKTKNARQQKEPLGSSVLSVGIEILLCVDVLRFTECHLRGSGQTQTQGQSEVHDSTTTSKLVDRLGELIECVDGGLEREKEVDVDMKSAVLKILPIFYASYVQALHRHRGQLFSLAQVQGGGSLTKDGSRTAACAFLDVILRLVGGVEEGVLVGRTRVRLLKVLLEEGGYIRSDAGVVGDEDGGERSPQEMMSKIVIRAIGVLDNPTTDSIKPLAIQSLSTIIRIDYDIVRPFVPQILTRVLVLPLDIHLRHGMQGEGEIGSYIEFLDLLLECHVKTRTLDELVGVMLSSIWEGPLSESVSKESRGVVVEDDHFLGRLGKAIGSFGTVGQCVGLVGWVAGFVERGLNALEGVEGKGEGEMDVDVIMGGMEECVGMRFGLGARIVCVVLACLNFEMVSSDEGIEKLGGVRGRVDCMAGELVRRLSLFERMERELEHGLCALLRMKYVLDRDVFVLGEGVVEDGYGGALEGLMHLLDRDRKVEEDDDGEGEESFLPELVFELVRTVFLRISTRRKQLGPSTSISEKGHGGKGKVKRKKKNGNNQANENERFFDTLLAFVERYYSRMKTNIGWLGTDYDLSARGREGKIKCAIALVWMIVERYLSELDLLATPRQIRRFLDVVFGVGVVYLGGEKAGNGLVDPEGILLNMLHSAWFWEFGRVRKELVEFLKERTSPLSPNRLKGGIGIVDMLKERASTFQVLLYFPLEYFSFQVLSGFMGCAVEVDGGLVRQRDGDEEEDVVKSLVVLRVFVRRVCLFVGGGGVLDFRGEGEEELLLRMLEEPIVTDCDAKEAYLGASLDLADVWLTRLIKSSKKINDPEPLLRVLKTFNLDSICGSGRGHKWTLAAECFIRMVLLLDREMGLGSSNGADIHEDVLEELRVLRATLVEGLYVQIMREFSKGGLEDEVTLRRYVGLVRVWDSLICLGKCVGGFGDGDDHWRATSRFLADNLVSILVPHVQLRDALDGGLADLCTVVFGVTLGEAECRGPNRGVSDNGEREREGRWLEVVLAIYVSWANKVNASGIKEMDSRLGRTTKRMAVSDFEHFLSFIAESLLDAPKSRLLLESRLTQLVHVGSLLIHDHPSHSMSCIQKFMAMCLGLFNDNPVYVEGDATLRLQVLEMVGQYCSDQQAALRAQDTSLIWLLISKVLAPSQTHDFDTRTEIFHNIVSILMCLIRLRRDLVALGLPHLGLILRRMVQGLRGCRANLGAKQMAMVMNTQPRWISHTRSLGGGEAKALSRLLESLTLKTTIRVAFNNADTLNPTKSESLAKPFSKHAAYVLKAYVEAMNDPLCVMSLEVRKELREGLFALCGMMSVHSRDALMVGGGLDAGGKGVLKSVWREWEGVRYVGKG